MTIPLDYPTNVTKKNQDIKTLHADFSVFICIFFCFLLFDEERRSDESIKNPAAMESWSPENNI